MPPGRRTGWSALMLLTSRDGLDLPRWVRMNLQRWASLLDATTVGLDLANQVFKVHGVVGTG